MNVTFFDQQEVSNPLNGLRISNQEELDDALGKSRNREPFFFELFGENGYNLLVGFGNTIGCVQHSSADGEPPYLVAVAPGAQEVEDYFEFLTGGTPTPIPTRNCMSWDQVRQITAHFIETGARSLEFSWDEV